MTSKNFNGVKQQSKVPTHSGNGSTLIVQQEGAIPMRDYALIGLGDVDPSRYTLCL